MNNDEILNFYKTRRVVDGFLDFADCPEIDRSRIARCTNKERYSPKKVSFYEKYRSFYYKKGADAEILLSRIYPIFGLKSATYFPFYHGNYIKFLLSENIETPSTLQGDEYYFFCSLTKPAKGLRIEHYQSALSPENPLKTNVLSNFTNKCLKNKQIMRVLDVASFNYDRVDINYFYKLEGGKASDIILYDYERSGAIAGVLGESDCENVPYQTDFKERAMQTEPFLEEFKNNEKVNELLNVKKLANEIGSLDIDFEAKEIKHQTNGYKIEQRYIDALSSSYNFVAEELVK